MFRINFHGLNCIFEIRGFGAAWGVNVCAGVNAFLCNGFECYKLDGDLALGFEYSPRALELLMRSDKVIFMRKVRARVNLLTSIWDKHSHALLI